MQTDTCPKCSGDMQKGFIADTEAMGHQTRQHWGTGIKVLGAGLDNALPVSTYRCTQCGYLESYAK